MKRRILSLFLCMVLFLSFQIACFASDIEEWTARWDGVRAGEGIISITPGTDESSLTFTWLSHTYTAANGFRLSSDAQMLDETRPEVTSKFIFSLRFRNTASVFGLVAGSEYYYSYEKDGEWSEPVAFTAPGGESFEAVFVSDAQIGRSGDAVDETFIRDTCGWDNTLRAALSTCPGVDFALSAGDQAELALNPVQYNALLAPDSMRSLPMATALGNHDFYWPFNNLYFSNPNVETVFGSSVSSGYYFSCGNAVFIVLNSNNPILLFEHELVIENALEAYPDAMWRVVMMHHTIYSAGSSESSMRESFSEMFDYYGIDLVLSGHDHTYCRTHPLTGSEIVDDGTVYISAGSASGSNMHSGSEELAWYRANEQSPKAPTYTILSFNGGSLSVDTYRSDTNELIDSTSLERDGVQDAPEEQSSIIRWIYIVMRYCFTALLSVIF